MSFTKVAPAGIGTEPGTSIRIGDSLLHSTGIDIGTGTGIGVTIRKHGDATFTGIVTAASFSGSGANLTGIDATSIKHTDGNVKVQAINTGANLTGNLSVSGNLGVAGVLTYEDVTNVDSIGIITARSTVSIADSIVHLGDTNTSLRFPSADTITAETAGLERLRIASDGVITAQKSATFGNTSDSFTAVQITSSTSGISELRFADTTANVGYVKYEHSGNNLILATNESERLRIDSSGNVGVGTNVGSDSTGNAQAFTIGRAGVNGQLRFILKNQQTGFGNGAGFHQCIDGANVFIENRTSGGYLDFVTINSGTYGSRMRILSDGKVGISSSIPQRPLDVRGEVFANRFTAYSAPTSTYNNQTTGVKYGARGGYTLTLGGTRSGNTNSFTIFEAKDFNNSKYFCLEISFCHAGGGIHGSYRRFAGICNGYTSIQTWNDTGNVNVGGGSGFAISKPDVHTLRCVWNGCTGFADSYTLYCMLHVSNGNSYFSAIDSAFY